jgi:hypothetical protein
VEQRQNFSVSCAASSKIFIQSAVYQGKSDSSYAEDVTDVVNEICSNKESCFFTVSNEILKSDPCPWEVKELQVTYICNVPRRKLQLDLQYSAHVICFSLDKFGPVSVNIDYPLNDIPKSKV